MAMPMLAGVGLLSVCCISSSVASTMMGGDGDDSDKGAGPAPDPGPVLPKAQYVKIARPTGTYPTTAILNLSLIHI